MLNISTETQEAFHAENGMTIEEAIQHIEQWIDAGTLDQVEAGIAEVKKFAPELGELERLETKLRAKKSGAMQEAAGSQDKQEEFVASKSDMESVDKSEKFLAAIGYFSFLAVLPLVLKKDSEFCQFHGKQGLALAIVAFFMSGISVILPGGFGLFSILHLIISVYGFMQANKGKLWNMPVVGEIARKMPF